MKKYFKFIGIAFFLSFFGILAAQDSRMVVQFLSVEDGLSARRVNSICQSPDGFVWLATNYGLNRYDGEHFKEYNQKTHRLLSDKINRVFATKDNLLWLLYGGHIRDDEDPGAWNFKGLNVLDIKEDKLIPFSDVAGGEGFLPKGVRGGNVDKEGHLWLWTKNGEVFFYDGTWRLKMILPDRGKIDYVIPADKDQMWLSYEKKLVKFDKRGEILEEEKLPFFVKYLHLDKEGTLWLRPNRLIRTIWKKEFPLYFKTEGQSSVPFAVAEENSIIQRHIPELLSAAQIDKDERIWISNEVDLEIVEPKTGKVNNITQETSALSDSRYFSDFCFGQDGLVFLGTDEGFYIIHFEENLFTTYICDKQPPVSTRGILDYTADSLLIFTYGNAFVVDKKNGGERIIPSLEKHNYYGAIIDTKGNIWLGGHSRFLTRFDRETEEVAYFKYKKNSQISHAVLRPYEDQNTGRIWLGCTKGLSYLDKEQQFLVEFDPGSSFPEFNQQEVNGFYQNKDGLWICTTNGLYLYREGEGLVNNFRNFPYSNINHIYEDKDHIFWLSTLGGGLIRWDRANNKIRHFTTDEGLSNNVIYSSFEDEEGHLWLPSNDGLMDFDKTTYKATTYFPYDGLSHEEFNNASYCRTREGRLHYGGINGVLGFDPEVLANKDTSNVNLLITGFKKSNANSGSLLNAMPELSKDKTIKLFPWESSFQLHFALLDFKGEQQINYAYRIEGVDDNWAYTSRNFIHVSRLPFGSYTLRVRGQGGGKWSANELVIPIQIIRPLYRKAWVIILVSLLAFGLGAYLVRWRIRFIENEKYLLEQKVKRRTKQVNEQNKKLKAMNDTKDQFFGIVAHDLRGPMLSFRGLSKKFQFLMKNKQEDRLEELGKSVDVAYNRLERLLDNLLNWALLQKGTLPFHPGFLELHDFSNEIIALFDELAAAKNIFIYNEIEKPTVACVDADALSSIFRNLLDNAIRFSKEGSQISIMAVRKKGMLHCAVKDQGVGIVTENLETLFDFDPQKRRSKSEKGGTGLGLQLCKELTELHSGQIWVESQPDKGTTVIFSIPHQSNPCIVK